MTTPTSIPVYTQGFGTAFTGGAFVSPNAPAATSILGPNGPFKLGQIWIDSTNSAIYILGSLVASQGVISANWEQLTGGGSGAVISVNGTANQVAVSPTTGNVVVSLTDGISLGSFQATTPPVGGMLIPGQVVIGSDAPTSMDSLEVEALVTNPYGVLVSGILNEVDGSQNTSAIVVDTDIAPNPSSNQSSALLISSGFSAKPTNTTGRAFGILSEITIAGNSGTITDAGNIFTGAGAVTGTPATNAYGGFFSTPTFGSASNIALYSQNSNIGYAGVSPPASGLIVSGQSSFGTSTPDSRAFFTIDGGGVFPWGLNTSGLITALTVSNNAFSVYENGELAPAVSSANLVGFNSNTFFSIAGGTTATQCVNFYASPRFTNTAGTVTTAQGFFAAPFVGPLVGTLTNAYGGYFTIPGLGTNQTSLYADDISSGVLASGVATKGTIRSAPPNSSDATTSFGVITFANPIQNTLGYDIIVTGTIDVASATGAAIIMGVGPSPTPTPSPITQSLTTASDLYIGFSAYVPSGYYLVFAGLGGALVVSSIVSAVTPV